MRQPFRFRSSPRGWSHYQQRHEHLNACDKILTFSTALHPHTTVQGEDFTWLWFIFAIRWYQWMQDRRQAITFSPQWYLCLWNFTFQWSTDSCLRSQQKGGLHGEAWEVWGFFQGSLTTLCHAKSAQDVMGQAKAFQSFPRIRGLCSKLCDVDPLGYWSGWSTKRGRGLFRTVSQPVVYALSLHPWRFRRGVSLGHDWKCFLPLPTKEIKEMPNCLYLFCHHGDAKYLSGMPRQASAMPSYSRS